MLCTVTVTKDFGGSKHFYMILPLPLYCIVRYKNAGHGNKFLSIYIK